MEDVNRIRTSWKPEMVLSNSEKDANKALQRSALKQDDVLMENKREKFNAWL